MERRRIDGSPDWQNIMSREIITGLKITNNSLEWTSLEKIKDGFKTVDSGKADLESHIAAEGEDVKVSDQGLTALISKNKKYFQGTVTLGLSSEQILLRVIKLPAVPDDELRGMVDLQIDKLSPFPVENMVVSYEILEKGKDFYHVLVAAIKNDVVDQLGKLLANADIFPSRVDADVLGWAKLLKESNMVTEAGRQIVILLAEVVPEIIVFQDGLPIVFRSLSGQGPLSDDEFASEIAGETASTIMSLELEHGVSKSCSLSVWHHDALPEKLEENLRQACPYELSIRSITELPPVSGGFARRSAEGGQLLDLTPLSWRVTGGEKLFKQRVMIAAGGIIGAWALSIIIFLGGLFYQQNKLEVLQAEFEITQKPAKEVMDMRRRVNIVKRYSDRTYSVLECLREVVGILPEGIDLTSFEYKRASGPPTVTINALATAVDSVYEFKNGLDGSKLFLKGTLKGPITQKDKQAFQIDMKLPVGGEE